MRAESPETLAQSALIWLAGREEDFARLLSAAGLHANAVRPRAQDPEFLGFVLDFILSDEPLARAFAESARLGPEDALRARAALPGGDAPFWT
jgi:hypothetical protein